MTCAEQLKQVHRKLQMAQLNIVSVAAEMQARGVDTSGLSGPVIQITAAMAELERIASSQLEQAEMPGAGQGMTGP